MSLEIHSPSAQVANHLRTLIHKRRWTAELPGTPALAEELAVDRKTIMAAFKILEEEGLLESQGSGRPRKIAATLRASKSHLSICLILYDDAGRQDPMTLALIRQAEEAGHSLRISDKTLPSLGMNVERIAQHVTNNPADAWLMVAASREVLEWFANQKTPAMAIFGRRRQVPIASVGPDKEEAYRLIVRRLVALGHRRIVMFAREERRLPTPGYVEAEFLKELQSHGITPGDYHLPHWQDHPDSFHECLQRLFRHTPPTALIINEPQFFFAAQQHLSQLGIVAPSKVSLICSDSSPIFEWGRPQISHIHWGTKPVIQGITHWINQLSRGINPRKHLFTKAEFIEGGTIGPAPR